MCSNFQNKIFSIVSIIHLQRDFKIPPVCSCYDLKSTTERIKMS